MFRADLTSANLVGANLNGADLSRALMVFTALHSAGLKNATMCHMDMFRADFTGADLRGADWTESTGDDVILNDAKMQGMVLADVRWQGEIHAEDAIFGTWASRNGVRISVRPREFDNLVL